MLTGKTAEVTAAPLGFWTLTDADPAVAISLAGTDARVRYSTLWLVVRAVPFHRITALGAKDDSDREVGDEIAPARGDDARKYGVQRQRRHRATVRIHRIRDRRTGVPGHASE